MTGECKRIEEGFKKAMNKVQQNFSTFNDKYDADVEELENQYKKEQMRLQYKDKC